MSSRCLWAYLRREDSASVIPATPHLEALEGRLLFAQGGINWPADNSTGNWNIDPVVPAQLNTVLSNMTYYTLNTQVVRVAINNSTYQDAAGFSTWWSNIQKIANAGLNMVIVDFDGNTLSSNDTAIWKAVTAKVNSNSTVAGRVWAYELLNEPGDHTQSIGYSAQQYEADCNNIINSCNWGGKKILIDGLNDATNLAGMTAANFNYNSSLLFFAVHCYQGWPFPSLGAVPVSDVWVTETGGPNSSLTSSGYVSFFQQVKNTFDGSPRIFWHKMGLFASDGSSSYGLWQGNDSANATAQQEAEWLWDRAGVTQPGSGGAAPAVAAATTTTPTASSGSTTIFSNLKHKKYNTVLD